MLEHQRYLMKERVKYLSSVQSYDIYEGDDGKPDVIGVAEEKIGFVTQAMRWFVSKQFMPTLVEVREKPDDSLVFTIRRGWYLFRSRVEVHDSQGNLIGYFKSKLISWSGGFYVYDARDQQFAELKGNLIGFNYKILTPDRSVELGSVSKKWKGIGEIARNLFTSADTYMIEVSPDLAEQPIAKMLILAAALATDIIFKSESRGGADVDLGGE